PCVAGLPGEVGRKAAEDGELVLEGRPRQVVGPRFVIQRPEASEGPAARRLLPRVARSLLRQPPVERYGRLQQALAQRVEVALAKVLVLGNGVEVSADGVRRQVEAPLGGLALAVGVGAGARGGD